MSLKKRDFALEPSIIGVGKPPVTSVEEIKQPVKVAPVVFDDVKKSSSDNTGFFVPSKPTDPNIYMPFGGVPKQPEYNNAVLAWNDWQKKYNLSLDMRQKYKPAPSPDGIILDGEIQKDDVDPIVEPDFDFNKDEGLPPGTKKSPIGKIILIVLGFIVLKKIIS